MNESLFSQPAWFFFVFVDLFSQRHVSRVLMEGADFMDCQYQKCSAALQNGITLLMLR